MIRDLVPIGLLHRVLQNLLRERVPVNDIVTILETLLDIAPSTKDIDIMTEHVRQGLARYITKQFAASDGVISVISLDPRFESALTRAMGGEPMSPDVVSRLLRGIESCLEGVRSRRAQPVILCSLQRAAFPETAPREVRAVHPGPVQRGGFPLRENIHRGNGEI